eukprot:890954-Pelagomonas_calceolata.AAC.5
MDSPSAQTLSLHSDRQLWSQLHLSQRLKDGKLNGAPRQQSRQSSAHCGPRSCNEAESKVSEALGVKDSRNDRRKTENTEAPGSLETEAPHRVQQLQESMQKISALRCLGPCCKALLSTHLACTVIVTPSLSCNKKGIPASVGLDTAILSESRKAESHRNALATKLDRQDTKFKQLRLWPSFCVHVEY